MTEFNSHKDNREDVGLSKEVDLNFSLQSYNLTITETSESSTELWLSTADANLQTPRSTSRWKYAITIKLTRTEKKITTILQIKLVQWNPALRTPASYGHSLLWTVFLVPLHTVSLKITHLIRTLCHTDTFLVPTVSKNNGFDCILKERDQIM